MVAKQELCVMTIYIKRPKCHKSEAIAASKTVIATNSSLFLPPLRLMQHPASLVFIWIINQKGKVSVCMSVGKHQKDKNEMSQKAIKAGTYAPNILLITFYGNTWSLLLGKHTNWNFLPILRNFRDK